MTIFNFPWVLFALNFYVTIQCSAQDPNGSRLGPIDSLFTGYDCSSPLEVTTTSMVDHRCQREEIVVDDTRNATIQIVRHHPHRHSHGWRCHLEVLRETLMCVGGALKPIGMANKSITILSGDECRTAAITNRLNLSTGVEITTNLSRPTIYYYYETSQGEKTSRSDIQTCAGRTFSPSHYSTYSVKAVTIHFKMEQETFVGDDLSIQAELSDIVLPCSFNNSFCFEKGWTYTWDIKSESCPRYEIWQSDIQGMFVKSSDGREIFVSTDGSQFRLRKLQTFSNCGRTLHSTQVGDIFLHDVTRDRGNFDEMLNPSSFNLTRQSLYPDNFTSEGLRQQLSLELAHQDDLECFQRHHHLEQESLLHPGVLGSKHSYLGNGIFALSNGEVLHRFRCRSVVVEARESNFCYEALPIKPFEWLEGQRQSLDLSVMPEWFLEPVTHRLTHLGIKRPCLASPPNKFMNRRGNGVSTFPYLHLSPLHQTVGLFSLHWGWSTHDQLEIDGGQLSSHLNNRLEFLRRSEAWTTKMANGASKTFFYNTGDTSPLDILSASDEYEEPTLWVRLSRWYLWYGLSCAALWGVYVAISSFKTSILFLWECRTTGTKRPSWYVNVAQWCHIPLYSKVTSPKETEEGEMDSLSGNKEDIGDQDLGLKGHEGEAVIIEADMNISALEQSKEG